MDIKLIEGSSYTLLTASGKVALFDEKHLDVPANARRSTFREVYDRYVEGGATRKTRRGPGWATDEAILLASPFSCLERMSSIQQLTVPLDRFRDRVLSISVTSHARIGAAANQLAEEMVLALAPFAVNGTVSEVVEFTALLARRSQR